MTFSFIVATNDCQVLQDNLLRSPDVINNPPLLQRGLTSAAAAYNDGLSRITSEIVIFAHQDVFFPAGWLDALAKQINFLNEHEPAWAVLGVYGVTSGGQRAGHIHTTGLGLTIGSPLPEPVPAQSLDELVIVLRRSSGLSFDPNLPGFHLYGTDICLQARAAQRSAWIISNFCLHNSQGIGVLPPAFWRSYSYMRRRWSAELPVHSPCVPITRGPGPFIREGLWRSLRYKILRPKVGRRVSDPAALCGSLLNSSLVPAAAH